MTEITFDDFKKIEFRVAKILEVQEIPGASKLWKLLIDVGLEKKEIVAGIKIAYSREALLGKSIVVVNNLTSVAIRGVESKGMLLAAKNGEDLTLLALDKDFPAGSLVS